jgi:Bacterial Ig-like domain (group 3)
VDTRGNLYISDTYDNRVLKPLFPPVNFGSVNAASTSPVFPLMFTFDTAGTLGSTAVLTQGATGLDFADAGTGTCTAGTAYIIAASCTIDVTLTPRSPGVRLGAAELLDSSGNILATAPLTGIGVGPQVTFPPGTKIPIVGGLSYSFGVAVDASGNVFITLGAAGTVYKETLSGGIYSQTTIASGFGDVGSLAVDGSGNVYVVNGSSVYKETLSNGIYSQSTAVSDVGGTTGIAVDGSGNLYLASSTGVYKETLSNGSYTQTQIGTGFTNPSGVAVDGSGNVYIADSLGGKVYKETLQANGGYVQSTAVKGLTGAYGVAVDGRGNLYLSSTVASGSVTKIDVADPPHLTFAATEVGSTSTDSPQTVTVSNIGNAALVFPVPRTGTNPANPANNFALDDSTTCPRISTSGPAASVAVGGSCVYAINFVPAVAGVVARSLGLIDTSLNATGPVYATQSISLGGTGIAPADATQTTVSALPNPVTAVQPVTLTATVSDTTTPATVPTGGASFTDSVGGTTVSLNGGAAVPLSGGTATLPVTLTVAGAHTITANYAGVSGTLAVSTGSVSLTVAAIVPTLSFGPIAAKTYGNLPFAVSATSASSGAVTYAVVSGPATITGNIVTLTGVGTVALSASQAASGNYAAATANATLTVAPVVPTLNFTPIAAQTYGNAPFAVSATSASSGAVTYTVVSGPATIAGNLVTLTGAGTVMLSASQAASGNYAVATATTSFNVAAASGTPIVPTLSFTPIAAQTLGNAPFTVSASSASSGAVTYTVVSGPATIVGNLVTLTGAGTVVLSASQAAIGNYAVATATTSFTVAAAPPGFTLTTTSSSSGGAGVLPGGAAAFNLMLARPAPGQPTPTR